MNNSMMGLLTKGTARNLPRGEALYSVLEASCRESDYIACMVVHFGRERMQVFVNSRPTPQAAVVSSAAGRLVGLEVFVTNTI